ncbi:MAG TPA: LysR family transcriptional regulator [Flavobacteriaceae bacterium]|nr:LysR family transcriptional regulator [Flavobacteriaceae bacterium]
MDYKLLTFKAVAFTKSFTTAARNLNISQPAVSKTIKNLENEYGKALFNRKANTIELTADGRLFLIYAEKIIDLYTTLKEELSTGNQSIPKQLKIGASTTIAYHIIPKLIAFIQADYPDTKFNLISGNTTEIQEFILKHQLDFAVVEGENHNKRLSYQKFVKDELVLVTRAQNLAVSDTITKEELIDLPFIKREIGSGSLQVIENNLDNHRIKLNNIQSILGSTESIKNYLQYTNCFAFISIHSINRELLDNRLRIIEIEGLSIERWFYFISRQGFQSRSAKKLQLLFKQAYNKK